MGNCLGRKSSTVWAGDDWESINAASEKSPDGQRQRLLGETGTGFSSSSSSSSSGREVKIKISKKQLEELLGRVEVHDMPPNQMLSSLLEASDLFEIQRQRSWRPTLKSIPEFD